MRYFIELAYDGFAFSGFQIQPNAPTIQSVLEEALFTIVKRKISLTGSSRTDAQVNAFQNYFHFEEEGVDPKIIYNLNAILPPAIVVKSIVPVAETAHARFSATARTYEYLVCAAKNPFYYRKAYYFPYKLKMERLEEIAGIVKEQTNFGRFCKANAQVSHYGCRIEESYWEKEGGMVKYTVQANRFLRGMVKALVGTMLQYGTGKINLEEFMELFSAEETERVADFSPPGYGLYLKKVTYPENIFLL